MTGSDSQPEGEGEGPTQILTLLVVRGKKGQDDEERDEQLHTEPLPTGHLWVESRGGPAPGGGGETLKDPGPDQRPDHLRHDVQDSSRQTDAPCHKVSERDGRVNVTATHVIESPDHGGVGKSKTQRYPDHLVLCVPVHTRPAPHEDQK